MDISESVAASKSSSCFPVCNQLCVGKARGAVLVHLSSFV